ncbi:MAG: GNAT family N-acetyltransferase [Chloroflexota bacterium]|nr:GNAT family N-acetyltransferase [Chloroflexota bacterium]
MTACTYCHANALYRDRESGAYLCPAHARLEVTGPRGEVPRPPLTIRPATSADRACIAELANYFWGEVVIRCFGHNYRVDVLPAFVACDGDEIVGVASYAREEDSVNLVMLNVLPQWQGRGAARGLIMTVAESAHAEGASRLAAITTNDDLPALGLYQRLGFTITRVLVGELLEHHGGVELGFAGTPVRDEIQMELLL